MAEVLALVSGILALVQTGDRLKELLNQIRPFFDAPKEIDRLVKEVSHLKTVIHDLQSCVAEIRKDFVPDYGERCENLQTTIEEGTDILLELEGLILNSFLKPSQLDSEADRRLLRMFRVSWIRKKEKVEGLRQRLRDVKITVLVQLGGFQTLWYKKLQKSIDGVAFAVTSNLSQNDQISDSIKNHFDDIARFIQLSSDPLILERLIGNSTSQQTAEDPSAIPNRRSAQPVDHSLMPDLVSLKARVERYYQCKNSCPCSCHRKKTLKSLTTLNQIIGSFDIAFPSTSIYGSVCDVQKCNARKMSILSGRYLFPKWFLSRLIVFKLLYSRSTGPELLLRVSRIVPCHGPLFKCIYRNDFIALKHLFDTGQASPHDIDDQWSITPLIAAALGPGNVEMMKYLLYKGADPMHTDAKGVTLHSIAWVRILRNDSCQENPYHQLRSLIPEIDVVRDTGFTILHKIVLGQHAGNMENEVRQNMSTVDCPDNRGMSPLHWAAYRGDLAVVTKLLQLGANPNTDDWQMTRPLTNAIDRGNVSCILELLRHGAEVIPKTDACPLNTIARSKNSAALFLPIPPFWTPVVEEIKHLHGIELDENSSCAEILIQAGAKVNALDSEGMSALFWAVRDDNSQMVDFLLHRGADFLHTKDGLTLLHLAAEMTGVETLRVLNSHKLRGLDVNRRFSDGLTVLDWAERREDSSKGLDWLVAWVDLIEGLLAVGPEAEDQLEDAKKPTIPISVEIDGIESDADEEIFADVLEWIGDDSRD